MITENNLIMFNRQLFNEFGQGVFGLIVRASAARLATEGKTVSFSKPKKGELTVRHFTRALNTYNEAIKSIDGYTRLAWPNGNPGYRERVRLAITRHTEIKREYRKTNP